MGFIAQHFHRPKNVWRRVLEQQYFFLGKLVSMHTLNARRALTDNEPMKNGKVTSRRLYPYTTSSFSDRLPTCKLMCCEVILDLATVWTRFQNVQPQEMFQ